jgi:hypothetical protein
VNLGALDRELAWFVDDANNGWAHMARARQMLLERQAGMVAKVHGLGRFIGAVQAFNVNGDLIGAELERLGARFAASTGSLKDNIENAYAALDTVDELNAAFGGNGGPPLVSSAPSAPLGTPPPNSSDTAAKIDALAQQVETQNAALAAVAAPSNPQ